MGGHRDADRGVDPGQLLDRERVGEGRGAAAAVLLRERDPHQPELAQLGDELVGERLRPVELLGHRRDLVAGELADGVAQQALLVGELEVQRRRSFDAAVPSPDRRMVRRGDAVGCREEEADAVPGRALADVLASHVPGGAGDVEVTHGTPSTNSSRNDAA